MEVIKEAQPERLSHYFPEIFTANWIAVEEVFQRRTYSPSTGCRRDTRLISEHLDDPVRICDVNAADQTILGSNDTGSR